MVKKIAVGGLLVACALLGGWALVATVEGQGSPDHCPNMLFRWDYDPSLPPVTSWNILIQRRVGDAVSVDTVLAWPDQSYEVTEIEFGTKVSISVQGVNAAGTGTWSDWSDEHLCEHPQPDLPDVPGD